MQGSNDAEPDDEAKMGDAPRRDGLPNDGSDERPTTHRDGNSEGHSCRHALPSEQRKNPEHRDGGRAGDAVRDRRPAQTYHTTRTPVTLRVPNWQSIYSKPSQGSQVVKAAVCKTVYRWFDSIPWDRSRLSAPVTATG